MCGGLRATRRLTWPRETVSLRIAEHPSTELWGCECNRDISPLDLLAVLGEFAYEVVLPGLQISGGLDSPRIPPPKFPFVSRVSLIEGSSPNALLRTLLPLTYSNERKKFPLEDAAIHAAIRVLDADGRLG